MERGKNGCVCEIILLLKKSEIRGVTDDEGDNLCRLGDILETLSGLCPWKLPSPAVETELRWSGRDWGWMGGVIGLAK